ncbi:cytochrome P450 [Collybia nuda]|uniref:Cytochrome P450 n=1 Tax=Collybia nuda TaxID=64659 RepID=A0A9P6CQN5_9AGAR|nr:cytochrome P450 [Collybia nuda]
MTTCQNPTTNGTEKPAHSTAYLTQLNICLLYAYTMIHSLFYTLGWVLLVTVISSIIRAWIDRWKLRAIPSVGYSGVLTSYLGAIQFSRKGHELIQEGYEKYPGTAFKVPMLFKWLIVINGPKMLDDIRRAGPDEVNARKALAEIVSSKYTMGPEIQEDYYHVAAVRSPLTKNLATRFADVQDEIACAFDDFIPRTEEWTKVPALSTAMHIISRTSNRLFVGLPLCRNLDYLRLNEEYAKNVMDAGLKITLFPSFLMPLAAYFFSTLQKSLNQSTSHLGSIIQDRLDKEREYGPDWPEKPNDLITWLLSEAPSELKTVRDVTLRVLAVNFAAIHTTSLAFTHALYDLASRPSYVTALREEVESVIEEDGLNKLALGKMRKLDSFIKESHRLGPTGALVVDRKILKDFTFSNGVVIPAGYAIAAANAATNCDDANYPNAREFDGFRFSKMRESEGEGIKHQMVSPNLNYLSFGTGRYICPGRFFAVNELKAMLAYVLLKYDVKVEDGKRPKDAWFGRMSMPNLTASVMFRRRT